MKRMFGICVALAFALPSTEYSAQVEAAKADYAAYGTDARYLYLGSVPVESRDRALTALRFWLPHLSRSKPLEHQLPVRISYVNQRGEVVPTDMYRIDLELIGWGQKAWIELAKEYPYADFVDPLIIRGDWLLFITADAVVSKSYYTLLYADAGTPKNRNDLLKVFGIVVDDNERTATIIDEGKGGVSLRTRVVVEGPVSAGNWWESYDSRNGFGNADPLEQLNLGKLKFDAQEYIIPMRKFSLRTGDRGITLAYFLTNAQGVRQDEAPTDIVIDHTSFLGIPNIRTPGHCVACHHAFNGTNENAFREWVRLGIERFEKDKRTQEQREQFLLSKQNLIIKRGNEDFEMFTQLACGKTAPEAQHDYIEATEWYNDPVNLQQAALEVYAKNADELRQAIANYSDHLGPQEGVGRLASLAHGRTVSRKQFEGDRKTHVPGVFHQAAAALAAWRADK